MNLSGSLALASSGRVSVQFWLVLANCDFFAGLLTVSLTVAVPTFLTPCRSCSKIWRRRSESNRRMRLLQSPALPLGYPAAQNSHTNFVSRPKQVQVSPATASTGKTQPAPLPPKFLWLENSRRRDDARDQIRRGHVESRIPRAARRIGHANVNPFADL